MYKWGTYSNKVHVKRILGWMGQQNSGRETDVGFPFQTDLSLSMTIPCVYYCHIQEYGQTTYTVIWAGWLVGFERRGKTENKIPSNHSCMNYFTSPNIPAPLKKQNKREILKHIEYQVQKYNNCTKNSNYKNSVGFHCSLLEQNSFHFKKNKIQHGGGV